MESTGSGTASIDHHQTQATTSSTFTEPVFIDWNRPHDPDNPFNWSKTKKWRLTFAAFYFTLLSCIAANGYLVVNSQASIDLGVSEEVYLVGNMVFLYCLAIGPMALAPLSEVYGRRPVYLSAAILFVLFQIPQGFAVDGEMLIVFRALQGLAASAGNSMVGGTIADTFGPAERGLPMGLFTFFTFLGAMLGPLVSILVQSATGSWRWVFHWQLICFAPCILTSFIFLEETRGSLLLARRAARLTHQTGKLHRAVADDDAKARANFKVMLKTSLTRPFVFLFTEPIVIAISLWMSFAWDTVFLLVESIPLVFGQYPGFEPGSTPSALIFLVMGIGGAIGLATNLHQDYLYARAARRSAEKGELPKPEMRLPWACIGGVIFPVGIYWYAWAGRPPVHWALPAVGVILIYTGIFPIYLVSYSYLADVYESYASSAISASALLRNVLGGIFVLIARQLYTGFGTDDGAGDRGLGYAEASTLLAALATGLGLVPFWLWWWGARVRARSRVAVRIVREKLEEEERVRREGEEDKEKYEARLVCETFRTVAADDSEKRRERENSGTSTSAPINGDALLV